MAEGETHEQILVQIRVGALGIVQKLTAAGHHHEQTAAGSVVVLVSDEVLRKVGNALGKHCNLETGGTGVFLVRLEVVDVDFAHFCMLVFVVDFSWLRQIDLQGERIIALIAVFANLKAKKSYQDAISHILPVSGAGCDSPVIV